MIHREQQAVVDATQGYGLAIVRAVLDVLGGHIPYGDLTSLLPRLCDMEHRQVEQRIRAYRSALGNDWMPNVRGAGENAQ